MGRRVLLIKCSTGKFLCGYGTVLHLDCGCHCGCHYTRDINCIELYLHMHAHTQFKCVHVKLMKLNKVRSLLNSIVPMLIYNFDIILHYVRYHHLRKLGERFIALDLLFLQLLVSLQLFQNEKLKKND